MMVVVLLSVLLALDLFIMIIVEIVMVMMFVVVTVGATGAGVGGGAEDLFIVDLNIYHYLLVVMVGLGYVVGWRWATIVVLMGIVNAYVIFFA